MMPKSMPILVMVAATVVAATTSAQEAPDITLIEAPKGDGVKDLLPLQEPAEAVLVKPKTAAGVRVRVDQQTVRFLGDKQEVLKKIDIPKGARSLAFDDTVVIHPASMHVPGIPYDIRFVTADSDTELRKKGATIMNMEVFHDAGSDRRYLAVASCTDRGPMAKTVTEVLDPSGAACWTTQGQDGWPTPRLAIDGNRLAALYAIRPKSTIHILRTGNNIILKMNLMNTA